MYIFELPEIGEGVVEGEIVRWLVNEGESVATDQPICEIMTDKATVEISSPKSGRVARLHGKPGDVIRVHSALVEIDLGGGQAASSAAPSAAAPAPAARPAVGASASAAVAAPVAPPAAPPIVAASASSAGASVSAAPAPSTNGIHPAVAAKMPPPPRAVGEKALASPAVRAEAKSRGIELDALAGTGKGGRVTRDDLENYTEPKSLPAVSVPVSSPSDQRVPIIGLRRKIAHKMSEAWHLAPHFTYVDEVDASQLVELRKRLQPSAEARGIKLSYLPFIFKALAVSFREFPTLNAVMDEEKFELIVRGDVNIGIATDTPAGLYVPVVKRVQDKSILEIAAEMAEVTQKTREGKANKDQLSGSTFTVTSVGNIGGRFATPILNHPEVAILGVNQIHDRPMAINGQVVIRPMMYLSPSFDHRVIDGAVAARFVSALKALLENPQVLLLDLR